MNAYKNEKIIKIGEVEILLRPTFENMSSFESSVMSLDEMSHKLLRGKLMSMTVMCQIIFYFQVEKKLNLEEVHMLVQNDVGIAISAQVVPFITGCLTGYKNAEEAGKAVLAKMDEAEKKS